MEESLLIVGASARAAAMSARRGGFRVWAADRFGDEDLRRCAAVCRVEDYPAGLERALEGGPAGAWMYTGALENHPALVERMAARRTLCGIHGAALRRVRDPFWLTAVLRDAGLSAPRCAASGDGLPRDGSWLVKPLASAGGSGIFPLTPGPSPGKGRGENEVGRSRYFQERVEGIAAAGLFVGVGATARFLGVTRQLLGGDFGGRAADAYRYVGSIGPLRLSAPLAARFAEIGRTIAAAAGLRGLFGVDAVLTADDVWPVEVNPRYTASAEVLERATGLPAIAMHVAACRGEALPTVASSVGSPACSGKVILFAHSDLIVPRAFNEWVSEQNRGRDWPRVADIPAAGTSIQAGEPIVTVFAEGPDAAAVRCSLAEIVAAAEGATLGR